MLSRKPRKSWRGSRPLANKPRMCLVVKSENHGSVHLRFASEDVSNHEFGFGAVVLASKLLSKIISEMVPAGADDGPDPICSCTRSVPVVG